MMNIDQNVLELLIACMPGFWYSNDKCWVSVHWDSNGMKAARNSIKLIQIALGLTNFPIYGCELV